ncbi:MAG: 2-C-methyl-D-erythritol 2,4-cyclodiphosphate synthase [Sphaerochaeta sp.]|uniref:2-C-methyl-D-erythritol 2,4-cyclodiphosphate synthase n=1 Tax=Sphaerochaeta sp. TaxID=1972642 RepID=UPI003D0C9410
MRIGNGWDVHRLVAGRTLIVGGVTIPSEKGEAGHSDGDVLTHAIIDALLGAVAQGDIGSHFPDTDPEFKDADSLTLLARVMQEDLRTYQIINIDTTVILQRPKLREYVAAIRESLSHVLHVEVSCISVKAKTAEGILGELGSGDAIVAQAAVLISEKSC